MIATTGIRTPELVMPITPRSQGRVPGKATTYFHIKIPIYLSDRKNSGLDWITSSGFEPGDMGSRV